VVLARSLGPGEYGIYAFVMAVVSLLSVPAAMGLPTLVLRETARSEAAGDWGGMLGLWRWSTLAVIAMSGLAALAILAFLLWMPQDAEGARRATLLLAVPLIPLLALGNLRGAALMGLRRVVLGQLPEFILTPSFLLLLVALGIFVFAHDLTAPIAVSLHIAAASLAFIIGAALLFANRPKGITHARATYRIRPWIGAILPLALLGGIHVTNQQIGIVVTGALGSDHEAGTLRIAVQAAALVAFGLDTVLLTLSPHLARIAAKGDTRSLQQLSTAGARAAFAFSIVAFAGFALLGPWLIDFVFGPAYAEAYLPIVIIAGGQVINSAFGPVGAILNMSGHERSTLFGMSIAAACNIVLTILLVPMLGAVGAAIAIALTLFCWNVVLWRLALHKVGVSTFIVMINDRTKSQ
jgi:O-antigen/teichoic acid export membrane protein